MDDQTSPIEFASTDEELVFWVLSNDGDYLGGATVSISADRAICKIDLPINDIPSSTNNGDELVFEVTDLAGNRALAYWTVEGL